MAVIEIFDTDEEQAQSVASKPAKTPKTPKTSKPRSRSKKSAADTTAAVENTPVETKTASASAENTPSENAGPAEKKPRKPRTRKKAESADAVAPEAVAPEVSAPVEAQASPEADDTADAKPKRTRRGGKGRKRAETADTSSEQVSPEQISPEQALPEQVSPEQASSEQKMPEPSLAEPAAVSASEQTTSEQALPEQALPEQVIPASAADEEDADEASAPLLEISAAPEKVAIAPAPERSALEAAPMRPTLPALTQFSPAPNAPALVLPQAMAAAQAGAADAAGAESDGQSPSKSRSRSARRRKAARKRAEAAAAAGGTPVSSAAPSQGFAGAARNERRPAARMEIFDAEDGPDADEIGQEALERAESFESTVPFEVFDRLDDDAPLSELPEQPEASETAEAPKSRRSRSRRGRGKKAAAAPAAADDAAAADPDADYDEEDDSPVTPPKTDRRMLVSVLPRELVEVVIMDEGKVQEYYVEMEHQAKIRGNIYKAVVSNIDVNLQAAFVNYGNVKNGFLQIDEVHPEYWLTHHEVTKGHKYPPIQKVMKPGQEVLVQVVKEPNGAKGAFLTTWVSLAGRFLVLTPGQEQIGISRKVEDGEERNRLRELIKGLNPGEGLGAIVRTVSAGTSKTTLQKDLSFLKRVWKDIRKRAGTEKAPCLIYKEPSLATRAVRDYLSDDVAEVWVDDAETADAIRDMTSLLFPRKADLLHLHQNSSKTLWEQFKVRKYLDQIHAREVFLPSGGRLVFDQTEALMAIDINSGKSGGKTNFESMALRTNMEAAEMIAHQLRLRDIGGQVVIDFIEMRDQSHCREVEKTMRNAMKGDRARYDIGKMSSFGLMQIVRQRIGSSAISISQEPCPHCSGTGLRRNMEWQSLQILRDLKVQMRTAATTCQPELILPLETELAVYILNHKRERLCALEKEFGVRLEIRIGLDKVVA